MNIPLDPRAVLYFLSRRLLLWLFLSAWLALMLAPGIGAAQPRPGIEWAPILAWIGRVVPLLALVLALDAFVCYLRVRSYRVELTERGVALETGILNKTQEVLLYGKVQDIVVRRSVLERLLGLSTVVIQNAAGKPEIIPGLAAATGRTLRDELLKRLPA